ncbi:sterol desaturase family protein [Hymenobacter metallilatus]|uniref:Fatty acid hydroxylase family protein n=1 Tax=Hymenobacter metallilatus TaxID=2493666 RepID=A0A428JR79_9BACT|nr:sterol desaturase family protein [Hymenobacter metallilatus]RSK36076.1 fatty acid hydroxylase family protein [Hymenobacter metallilatus]
MDALHTILRELPLGFLQGLLLNGSVITLAYFIFWKKFKVRFAAWRIQQRQRADGRQIRSELRHALGTLLVGALFASVVLYLSSLGYTRIYTRFEEHPVWSVAGFFVLLLLDDTWFYWMHRLLHRPWLYRWVHRVHHQSVDVNPFSSLSFHWLEPVLLSAWIVPAACIIPIYAPVLGLVQLWGLLDNVKAHLGYELYPAGFNRGWLRFFTSSTHHNMHHRKVRGNYGVHLRIWDRLLGTEFEDYEAEFDRIQQQRRQH